MNFVRITRGLAFVAGLHVMAGAVPVQLASQAGASDVPRLSHALGYYDPELRRVVLIGGESDPKPGDRDQVWVWSGTRWTRAAESGPPGRVTAAAAYDGARRRAVVAGGGRKSAEGSGWEIVGDSWESDGRTWRRTGDIPARDHLSMVGARWGVLMFGGITGDRAGPWPNDTWTLGPDGWTRVASDGPPPRARGALAYDNRRRQVVLFGGVSAPSGSDERQTFFGDTWIWTSGRWRKATDTGPRGRYAHAMVFDERAGVVLLYGGAAAHRDAPLSDMWQWDGASWREIQLTGETPGHRYQPVMVYDRARGRTVLYGGLAGAFDTWECDGRRWHRVSV